MSQPFNPKRVLRQISNPLLKEFFERQGHPLDVEWDSISNTHVDDIFDAWQRLPDGPRKAIEIVFHDVHEMANEEGVRVIIEEGRYHGEDLSPLLETMDSRYDKAIWTFMDHSDLWDVPVYFTKVDSSSVRRGLYVQQHCAGTGILSTRCPHSHPRTGDDRGWQHRSGAYREGSYIGTPSTAERPYLS